MNWGVPVSRKLWNQSVVLSEANSPSKEKSGVHMTAMSAGTKEREDDVKFIYLHIVQLHMKSFL